MSITLTDPSGAASQIINSAEYVASTNQAEDSTHKNVRVRAEIYVGGVKVAVTEQPKALTAFNFNELLRRYITPLRYRGNSYYSPPVSSVLTGWTADPGGSFSTFTTAGKNITAAVTTTAGYAKSDVIAMAAGELYALVISSQTQNSGNLFARLHDGTNAIDPILIPTGAAYNTNRVYWFMAPAAGNYTIQIGSTGVADWEGTYDIMKMTALDTYGRPLVHYWVKFTEYWEDGSDVTTAGTSSKSLVAGFIHSQPKHRTCSEFVLKTGSVGNFLTLSQSEESLLYVSRNKMPKYENLITHWVHSDYETFTTSGTIITSAINTSASGLGFSDFFNKIKKGEKITVIFSAVIGVYGHAQLPQLYLRDSTNSVMSNIVRATSGLNVIELIATKTDATCRVAFDNDLTGDWSTSGILVCRSLSMQNNVFLSLCPSLQFQYSKTGIATKDNIAAYAGWGVIALKPYSYYPTSNNIVMSILGPDDVALTNTLYQPLVAACDKDRFVEFTNHLGGLDYVTFRGDYKRRAVIEKEFFKTAGRMRKPLTSYPLIRENLKTRFIDESMSLVADLIDATSVVLDDKEVTVLTDSVDTYSEGDLVINEIEIEYEE